MTVQVKLQPSPEQSEALLRTLETANAACNTLSEQAWDSKPFRQFPLHRLCYKSVRKGFSLSAQVVIRLISKVVDAYKLDQKRRRWFRKHGSISYDDRILSWNMEACSVSIWSLEGRLSITFVCGARQRKLLAFRRGETDLVYRDRCWYLFSTLDIPDVNERQALDWIGVDMGLVAIAQTSDGTRFAGGHLNGLRLRHRRLGKKLQKKGTCAACGHVDKRNRTTQSRFVCLVCGHRANADANASENIRRAAANRPDLMDVDALGVHVKSVCVTERSLVKSCLL